MRRGLILRLLGCTLLRCLVALLVVTYGEVFLCHVADSYPRCDKLQVRAITWGYPEDAPLNYMRLKTAWFKRYPAQTPELSTLMQWAEKAHQEATGFMQGLPVWSPWRVPAQRPWGVHPMVSVENACGFDAQTDLQIQLYVLACSLPTLPAATLPAPVQGHGALACGRRHEIFRGQKTVTFLPAKAQTTVVFPLIGVLQPELVVHHPSTTPLTWWQWWEPRLEIRSREGKTLWGPSAITTPSLVPSQAPQPARLMFEPFWMRTPLWYY